MFADTLDPIEAASANGGGPAFSLFRDLDDDLWALLLTQEYEPWWETPDQLMLRRRRR